MRNRNWTRLLVLLCAATAVVSARAATTSSVISFSSLDPHQSYALHGTLYLPDNTQERHPAVIVLHGTLGIDSRNDLYRDSLLKAGIATFEVDFKSGVYTGVLSRPRPPAFLPMAFAALKELRKQPAIAPDSIAIMGFSLGGHTAIDTAFEANRKAWMGEERGFAAHVAFYPVCKPYLEQQDLKMTGAPVIILYGTEDSYGEGSNVPAFRQLLEQRTGFNVTTVEYAGALHDFNHNAPAETHWDPVAIGHRARTGWNADAANDSVTQVVSFLRKKLNAQ